MSVMKKIGSNSSSSTTPTFTKSPSASSVSSKLSGIAALGDTAEAYFDDAEWNQEQEKCNSLEALDSIVSKTTANRLDIVNLMALKKTLDKHAPSFNKDLLSAFDELCNQQKNSKGKIISQMNGFISAMSRGVYEKKRFLLSCLPCNPKSFQSAPITRLQT